jgi:hypothetical protein
MDKLYDWSTGKYVSCSKLTKDGSKWIERNRKVVFPDENIESYADNKDYTNSYLERKEFYDTLEIFDMIICILSEFGFSHKEIGDKVKLSRNRICEILKEIQKKYKKYRLNTP